MNLTTRLGALSLAAAFSASLAAPLQAQAVSEWAQAFIDPTGQAFGTFGRQTLVQGDHMIITANGADNQGAAFALRRVGGVWTPQQKFTGSQTAQGDFFGMEAALDGTRLAIAATQDDDLGFNSGEVYLFDFDGTSWVETARLQAPDGDASDKFGSALALSGDVLVVGAAADEPGGIVNSGSAYAFRNVGGTWGLEQKLTSQAAVTGGQYGWALATDGALLLVSAIEEAIGGAERGAVYAYEHDGTSWNQVQRFMQSDGADGDRFGWEMDLDLSAGTPRLAVGATEHGGTGAVYIFERQGGTWVELDKVVSASSASGDALGWDVELAWPVLVAGAPGKAGIPASPAGSGDGAIFKFNFTGTQWVDCEHWVSADTNVTSFPVPQLGMAVGMDGDVVVGGAPFANTAVANNAGRVYRFESMEIGFDITTPTVTAGQNAGLEIWGGQPGQLCGIGLVGIGGAPYPLFIVTQTNLGLNGAQTFSVPAPPSLVGLNLQLIAGAIWQPGVIGISPVQTITIQ